MSESGSESSVGVSKPEIDEVEGGQSPEPGEGWWDRVRIVWIGDGSAQGGAELAESSEGG